MTINPELIESKKCTKMVIFMDSLQKIKAVRDQHNILCQKIRREK